jgi:hypothetical protein
MQEMIEKVDGRSVPHVKAVSDLSNAITGWITSHVLKDRLGSQEARCSDQVLPQGVQGALII